MSKVLGEGKKEKKKDPNFFGRGRSQKTGFLGRSGFDWDFKVTFLQIYWITKTKKQCRPSKWMCKDTETRNCESVYSLMFIDVHWCWVAVSMCPRDSRLGCKDRAKMCPESPVTEFSLFWQCVSVTTVFCKTSRICMSGLQNHIGSHARSREGTTPLLDAEQPGHGPHTCFLVAVGTLPALVVLAWECGVSLMALSQSPWF